MNFSLIVSIRPPGALGEDDFLSACIRCGLCARDCPYDTLKLAELGEDGPATGTPYFTARDIPCEMCDDIPCVAACPTGALEKSLDRIDDAVARMLRAQLSLPTDEDGTAYPSAVRGSAHHRALAREAAWLAARQAEVRREQARRAAARREAQRRLAARARQLATGAEVTNAGQHGTQPG